MNKPLLLPISMLFFLAMGIFFAFGFDANVRGLGDASVAVATFESSFLSFMDISLEHEFTSRLTLLGMSMVEMLLLIHLKLVRQNVAITYFIWPFSAFLATKIKFEFFVFPLAMVRTDFHWIAEGFIIFGLLALFVFSGEGNVAVILLYRMILLFLRMRHKFNKVHFLLLVACAFATDYLFTALSSLFPFVARFTWTRDFVNSDYSIIETAAVFFASFFLGVHPQSDFLIGWFFGSLIVFYVYGYHKRALMELFQDHRFYALVITIVLLSSITHAFQSARYYYVYPTLIAAYFLRSTRDFVFFSITGTAAAVSLYLFHNVSGIGLNRPGFVGG